MLGWTVICFASAQLLCHCAVVLFFYLPCSHFTIMSQLDCGFGEACQSVKRVLCVWSEQAYGRVKYPNYSEAHPCKCHLTYTQLLFYLTALKLYSTQPYIETRLNKRLEAIHVHRHVHKHTHNLSKHTYSLENNYRVWRGGKYTHTHTHTDTLSCMQEKQYMSVRMAPML